MAKIALKAKDKEHRRKELEVPSEDDEECEEPSHAEMALKAELKRLKAELVECSKAVCKADQRQQKWVADLLVFVSVIAPELLITSAEEMKKAHDAMTSPKARKSTWK